MSFSHHDRAITIAVSIFICLLVAPVPLRAEVQFDWVTIGNAGNAADTTGLGAVAYEYRIATTEVTNAQYAEFLNAIDGQGNVPYNGVMGSSAQGGIQYDAGGTIGQRYHVIGGRHNSPVNHVTWYDAVRFVNWLHNGQGATDTEDGAYTLIGGGNAPDNGLSVTRNSGARYFLPNQDEWYKAAFHDASAGTGGDYFLYANGGDALPVSDQPGDNPAAVNFFYDDGLDNGFNDGYALPGTDPLPNGFYALSEVGAYSEAPSPYGTFDQNGNVAEWNETLINGDSRGVRGGGYGMGDPVLNLSALGAGVFKGPTSRNPDLGFRIATAVPEPQSIAALLAGCLALMRCRARR